MQPYLASRLPAHLPSANQRPLWAVPKVAGRAGGPGCHRRGWASLPASLHAVAVINGNRPAMRSQITWPVVIHLHVAAERLVKQTLRTGYCVHAVYIRFTTMDATALSYGSGVIFYKYGRSLVRLFLPWDRRRRRLRSLLCMFNRI